jgi:hypothetical protein
MMMMMIYTVMKLGICSSSVKPLRKLLIYIRYLSYVSISEESNNFLWGKQWKTIEEIRRNEISAPIDTMGDALAH